MVRSRRLYYVPMLGNVCLCVTSMYNIVSRSSVLVVHQFYDECWYDKIPYMWLLAISLQNQRHTCCRKLSQCDQYSNAAEEGEFDNDLAFVRILCVCVCVQVCNHPDLFELRPILSPLRLSALESYMPSMLLTVFQHDPFKVSGLLLDLHTARECDIG